MKDVFGMTLHEGDIVAFRESHGHRAASLEACEVVGFTPKMVRLRRLRVGTLERVTDYRGAFIDRNGCPELCVRIDAKAYLGVSE